ncbi:MAG: hypothetical protein K6F93_04305 [Lachnospiraceae bacterium]|nr:hypothetical protein [Lachnospiraceae bacterium]
MEVVLVVLGLVIILAVKGIYDRKNLKKKLLARVEYTYGKIPDKKLTEEKKESLKYYHKLHPTPYDVDDITWNDLNMDNVFDLVNSCNSAYGEEYLYAMLRSPQVSEEKLKERGNLIKIFSKKKTLRNQLSMHFANMGIMKKISVFEYMGSLKNASLEGAGIHILLDFLFALSIAYIFINPPFGIIASIVMLIANIFTYFKYKTKIENYFVIIGFIVRSLKSAQELSSIKDEEILPYMERLKNCVKEFNGLRHGAWLVSTTGMGSSDMAQIMLDYLRMLFHLDLIKFNLMYKTFLNKEKYFNEIFETIGLLDSMIAVASFREMMGRNCEPDFHAEKKISVDGLYHPLIESPIPSSFSTERSVLLTGSNASGKSTFLKSVAINQILSQTIYTALAIEFHTTFFNIMSSMALKDDIIGGQSYYIVEIRSLKRIIERMNDEVPVLVFIDEVLKGTNTLERIAASSRILLSLSASRSLCFAATHDIELTFILENYYNNFHFEETVSENEVIFDYTLREGRAVSRNAIKLLSILGYPDEIIESATEMAQSYLTTNEWKVL